MSAPSETDPASIDHHVDATIAALAGPGAVARDDQRAAIHAVARDGARVLVVQATGWGKSAVYWAATAVRRAAGAGPTLVVSPLLALMRDQIDAAARAGLVAATVNSTNVDDWDDVLDALARDELDVLLVSPERLANPRFARALDRLAGRVGLVVIDEAHCISDWGFDFRPDYQRVAATLFSLSPGCPVLATTATANARVTADVAAQLGADTEVFRGSLARSSLRLGVVPGLSALERFAWVDEALDGLAGSGIVYAMTVAECGRLAGFLAHRGHDVVAYSSATPADERAAIEDRLRANDLKAVVATSALGMGYDKPDLAFCVHVGSPASPVAYYQQVGRAGRALDDAVAVLLPSEGDERLWDYFATASIPDPDHATAVIDALAAAGGAVSVARLEAATGIRRGRLEALVKVLAVDGAVERVEGGWRATGAPWSYDTERYAELRRVRAAEAGIMRSYARGEGCLMAFLQRSLDDPEPAPCGRCSVCAGALPDPGRVPSPDGVAGAQAFLRGLDVVIPPRKLWPGGASGRSGKIVGAADGRALAFADDPAWSDVLGALFGAPGEGRDAAVDAVGAALVEVLRRWKDSWAARPEAVAVVPSRDHGDVVAALAAHVAGVGRLPLLDLLELDGAPPPADVASAARVAGLAGLRVRPGAEVPAAPVLLVDARLRSGWTMTVAAAELRRAGASAVLPLVVHQLP
ncbi:MAG TPA: DEAD/DEAH box helicase [Acidimicrobiales bacterium]|nr:DEAD/DEAH box helicase [Acidimicrobiales bacterium]